MRCPYCASLEDRVVDSRSSEDAATIRRRRQCATCERRFTTFERIEEAPLVVLKRSGGREPFDRDKVIAGVVAAAKNRPLHSARIDELCRVVEEHFRLTGGEVPTAEVGTEVLDRLRELDGVAALRFASVYKEFEDPADFEAEIRLLGYHQPS